MFKKVLVVLFTLVASFNLMAESVHQSVGGENAYGKKTLLESKAMDGAESGKITRITGDMGQWGFMSYWFGIPSPKGKTILRFRIYKTADETAVYGVYKVSKGQDFITKIKVPEEAPVDSFVTVDVPVDSAKEWNGIALKKFEKSTKPSIWIDKISVVVE